MSVTSWGQGAAGSDAMSIIETPDIYIPHIYVIQPDFWQPLLTKNGKHHVDKYVIHISHTAHSYSFIW